MAVALKDRIQAEVVNPHLYRDVTDVSNASYFWRKVANCTEALGRFLIVMQSIVSFGSAVYDLPTLGFVSGSTSIFAMGLIAYSSYALQESKERTDEMNLILQHQTISAVPNLIAVKSDDNAKTNDDKPQVTTDAVMTVTDAGSSSSATVLG